jgi:L-ascorbate metabolism protein UlaG (beta-lactamase superfamily)
MVRLLLFAVPLALLFASTSSPAAGPARVDTLVAKSARVVVHPVHHASFLLEWGELVIAVDPVGDADAFLRLGHPHLVLVTHQHGDHFDPDVLRDVATDHVLVIAPLAVAEMVPSLDAIVLAAGDRHLAGGIAVTAVPAYNQTPDRRQFHPPGRDNGYLLESDDLRVYVSGDTEDVPELAAIGPVDAAFICCNLPFTMTVEQAARAAGAVRPRVLYPYHYRHRDGSLADLDRLRALLDDAIDVRVLAWY